MLNIAQFPNGQFSKLLLKIWDRELFAQSQFEIREVAAPQVSFSFQCNPICVYSEVSSIEFNGKCSQDCSLHLADGIDLQELGNPIFRCNREACAMFNTKLGLLLHYQGKGKLSLYPCSFVATPMDLLGFVSPISVAGDCAGCQGTKLGLRSQPYLLLACSLTHSSAHILLSPPQKPSQLPLPFPQTLFSPTLRPLHWLFEEHNVLSACSGTRRPALPAPASPPLVLQRCFTAHLRHLRLV